MIELGTNFLLQDEKALQMQLMKHLSHWAWVHSMYQYTDKHLIIADQFFIDKLRNARSKSLTCETVTPATYQAALPGKIKKILVFCQQNELAIVRDIQRKYPDIAVTSGTYSYALVGPNRLSKLREFKPVNPSLSAKPVIMLSTPYADAEFLSAVAVKNGLPGFHEYLARPFATWLQGYRGFQTARFHKIAEQQFSKGGEFHFLLQTDVLNSLFANTNFSLKRFIRYLADTEAKVILVTDRGKQAQAVRGQLVNRSPERSVWTKKPSKRMVVKYEPADMSGSIQRQSHLAEDEHLLGQIAASEADTMQVCLEDFVAEQAKVLGELAVFFGAKLPEKVETLDYDGGYELASNLLLAPIEYRRHMIDKLGLHLRPLL